MASHTQWQRLLKNDGTEFLDAQAADMAVPSTDSDGVLCANRRYLTHRVWNTEAAGSFDVDVWVQFALGERWFKATAAAVTVNNVSPTNGAFVTFEARGAIRSYVRCFNFAGGAKANARISGGD
jgi:hypothetical protein